MVIIKSKCIHVCKTTKDNGELEDLDIRPSSNTF